MHFTKVLGLALALVCASSVAYAGGGFTISMTTNDVSGDANVLLDSTGDLQGWSLAVCHDPGAIALNSVGDGAATAVVGSGGNPPAFDTITTFPDGWTVGVVIDFLGCCTLAPGTGLELNVMNYDVSGLAPLATSDICFCSNTLGSPAVSIVVVQSGASIPPAGIASCATFTGVEGPPAWTYAGSDESDTGAGASSSTVGFGIEDGLAAGADTQGFSMGWSASTANGTALTVAEPAPTGDLAGINGGTGPSFFGTSLFGDAWTVGVVYNFLGGVFLQYPDGSVAQITAEYSYDITQDDVATISVDNTLGSPPVSNVVVVGGASFPAVEGAPGTITLTLQVAPPTDDFIRGDCNDDGIVNIADAVWILNDLFLGGDDGNCPDACDASGDGLPFDSTDASYILNYRFLDGPPPPAPFPDCGGAAENCSAYSSCP